MIQLFFFACQQEATNTPLIDITAWSLLDLTLDPLEDHQPLEVDCDMSAFSVEGEQLEIRTDYCNYAPVFFETQRDIMTGTKIEALVLHTGLWAPEPTTAHFAFYIGDQLFWEEYPPIPSDTEFFFYEDTLTKDIPQGTQIYFHLHNHGVNDWKMGYFREVAD